MRGQAKLMVSLNIQQKEAFKEMNSMKKEKAAFSALTAFILIISIAEAVLLGMALEGCLLLLPMLLLQIGNRQIKVGLPDFILATLLIMGVRYTLMADAVAYFSPIVFFSVTIFSALKLGSKDENMSATPGIYMACALLIIYFALLGLFMPRFAAPLGAGIVAITTKKLFSLFASTKIITIQETKQ